jgi:ABC-type uncharacterized transport system involved in gliding motility auxiliary subunit
LPTILDRVSEPIRVAAASLVARSSRLPRHTLAWTSVALALILLLSVNLFASVALRNAKADLTQQQLFTISSGTRQILRSIDEPISINLYYSPRLREVAPTYGRYFERVRALLEQYRDLARGKLELAVFDPEPFSDAEDRAVAAGLRGIRINPEGETAYFGLVGRNATDNDVTIAFFTADREPFLEYDLTKLVHTLANPKKRVVGLITSLPLDGGMNPMAMMGGPRTLPAQMIMEQIRDFFEVRTLSEDLKEIAADIDLLMIAQPERLTPQAAYAIDQYVLGGGKILAFVDPVAEAGARAGPMGMGGAPIAPEFVKLLKAWGVAFDPSKAVGDIAAARRVQFGGGGRPLVTEYVAWLGLDRRNIDAKDVLSGGVDKLNLASAGFLTAAEGATTTLLPIIETSPQAMQIAAEKLQTMPDPVALLRAYKPEGKRLILAARVSGETKSAFADGPPKPQPDAAAGAQAAKAAAPDNATAEGAKEAPPPRPEIAAGDAKAKDGTAATGTPEPTTTTPAQASPADAGPPGATGGEAKGDQAKKAEAKGDLAKDGVAPVPEVAAKARDGEAAGVPAEGPLKQRANPHRASGRVTAIIVADSDLLADQFWVDVRDFLGQQVAIPHASNAAFVVNALENLSGSEALIALRGRGTDERPFRLVEELRRDAERSYREKEQALTTRLKEVQDQLAKYENSSESSGVILSESDRQAVDKFRADMLTVRRDLREVKRALRQDIDRLDGWLRFANIGFVPLLIAIGGGAWALLRRRASAHRRASRDRRASQGEMS